MLFPGENLVGIVGICRDEQCQLAKTDQLIILSHKSSSDRQEKHGKVHGGGQCFLLSQASPKDRRGVCIIKRELLLLCTLDLFPRDNMVYRTRRILKDYKIPEI